VVDFLFVTVELISLSITVERKSVEVGVFRRGGLWVTERKPDAMGRRPPTTVGVRKLGVTALLCGIKISAVHYLVLSQSTRVKDGTDGRSDRRDGQNYDSQHGASTAASHGKNWNTCVSA